MWNSDQRPNVPEVVGLRLIPADVLSYYDGPTIFVARVGLMQALCLKFDETNEVDYFVVAEAVAEKIDAVKAGRLSVRGAMESPRYWVLETTGNLEVRRAWDVTEFEFPIAYLPDRKAPLKFDFGEVPDTIEQAQSFFAVKFAGESLRRGTISFRKFNTLVHGVYEVASNYLLPNLGSVSKASILDFELVEPKLSSLLIAIKKPIVLEEAVRRRNITGGQDRLLASIDANRTGLLDGMEHVVEEARRGELSPHFAGENIPWLDALSLIAPTVNRDVEYVEVSAPSPSGARLLSIDLGVGERIRTAHKELERAPATISGRVDELNGVSGTFLLLTNGHRRVTCILGKDLFDAYVEDGTLRYGARVSARGEFMRRQRRDLLHCRSVTPTN